MDTQPPTLPSEPNDKHPFRMGEGGRFLVVAASAFVVLWGLQNARSVIIPMLMAGFLAIISYSVTSLLRRYLRFPHWLAVTATVIFDGGVLFGVISLINYLARDMVRTLQGDVAVRLSERYDVIMAAFANFGLEEHMRAIYSSPQDMFDVHQIISFTQSLTGQILGIMSTCTLVLIMMTFLLGEAPIFLSNLRRLPSSAKGKEQFINALQGIQRYLFIKTVSSTLTAVLVWILCAVMGIPFAFLWAVLAFVLNYIPTIGSIMAALPPIAMAVLLGSWGDVLIVTLGYIGINCGIGNGIEPLFLGKQFGIATSVILLSVIFWGWVWGPCGMLLAVPITVLLKLALESSQDLWWVAAIIDGGKQDTTPKH